jgi:hypothetical protein
VDNDVDDDIYGNGVGWLVNEGHWNGMFCGSR